jgi:hypothetical protein
LGRRCFLKRALLGDPNQRARKRQWCRRVAAVIRRCLSISFFVLAWLMCDMRVVFFILCLWSVFSVVFVAPFVDLALSSPECLQVLRAGRTILETLCMPKLFARHKHAAGTVHDPSVVSDATAFVAGVKRHEVPIM